MTLQKIEFEYDIPDGYRFARYGKPKNGESCLNDFGNIIVADCDFDLDWIIVEKIPEQESKKHRWHDLMIEFANDKTLRFECRDPSTGSWHDAVNTPRFHEDIEYRKKPTKKTVRFRNYFDETNCNVYVAYEHTIPDNPKWLGDWQEIEI